MIMIARDSLTLFTIPVTPENGKKPELRPKNGPAAIRINRNHLLNRTT